MCATVVILPSEIPSVIVKAHIQIRVCLTSVLPEVFLVVAGLDLQSCSQSCCLCRPGCILVTLKPHYLSGTEVETICHSSFSEGTIATPDCVPHAASKIGLHTQPVGKCASSKKQDSSG